MLGRVVFGSRTWIWTMAAPALAASSADCAICSGVTGTAGLRPGVSADPVTAHEIMTLRCMLPPSRRRCSVGEAYSEDGANAQRSDEGRTRARAIQPVRLHRPSERTGVERQESHVRSKIGSRGGGLSALTTLRSRPTCAPLCTALSLLEPVLGTNPNCGKGDFVRVCGTFAAAAGGGVSVRGGASEVRIA